MNSPVPANGREIAPETAYLRSVSRPVRVADLKISGDNREHRSDTQTSLNAVRASRIRQRPPEHPL